MVLISKFLQLILLSVIKVYQYCISPFIKPRCRFIPSCSEYAKQSIYHFGPLKGSYLALLRILKCNPFGGMGYDPVLKPKIKELKDNNGTKSEL